MPIKASQSSNKSKLFIEPKVGLEETSVENIDLMQEEFAYSEPVKTTLPKKIVKQKTTKKINSAFNKGNLASKKVNLNTKRNELVLKRNENKQLNTWETFKHNIQQGGKKKCTQPEIAMNQCQ